MPTASRSPSADQASAVQPAELAADRALDRCRDDPGPPRAHRHRQPARSFCRSHRQELIAAGRCDPDAAASELAQIRDDAISTVIAAALRTRGAAAPVPPARPGTPAYHTAAMITRPDPDAGKDENTALERLARLRAAIADPQPITAAEVKTAIRRWIGDHLPDRVRALGSPAKMRAWIDDQVTDPGKPPGPRYLRHIRAPRRTLVQRLTRRAADRHRRRRPRRHPHRVGGDPRMDPAGHHHQPAGPTAVGRRQPP